MAAQRTARVTIDFQSAVAIVPEAGYGVGMSVYDNTFTPPDLPDKLKAIGVTALRFPGGSYSDAYHWQTNSGTPGTGIYINRNDSFDHFMTMDVLPAGAQAVLTVNYGSNAAGSGGADPAEAAAWVEYANREKGWNVRYWEIGNEIGGNGYFGPEWEVDLHAPKGATRKGNAALSQTAYGKNALEFIRAMKAVDPSIKIGVGVDMPDTHSGNGNEALFKAVKDKIDFIIVHWYPKASTTDLTATDDIVPESAALREQVARFAGASQRNIPFAITETSGGARGAPRALFATDTFLTWFEAGACTVEWQEMHSDFLSDGKDAPLDSPGEPYYGMKMATLAARPGDTLVKAQSTTPMLAAHAVKRRDGAVSIVLINRHPNQSFAINVALSGATIATSGTRYDFGRANFAGASVWPSQGAVESKMDGLGSSFTVTVPAASESVIVIAGK